MSKKVFGMAKYLIMFSVLLFPAYSQATFFDYYGLGSRATAMGSAYTALANDSSAMYYNPAALPECGSGKYEFIAMTTLSNLNVGFRGDWEEAMQSREVDNLRQLEKKIEGVNELTEIGAAMVLPVWKDRFFRNVYIGFGGAFPVPDYALRVQFYNINDPIFLEYTNITHKFHLLAGLGVDVDGFFRSYGNLEIPGVSIGITLNTFFDIEGRMQSGPTYFEMAIPYDMVLIYGVLIKPFENIVENRLLSSIQLGFAYRPELSLDLNLDMALLGKEGAILATDLYNPEQLSFGVGIAPLENLIIGYTLEKYAWSSFYPPYMYASETSDPFIGNLFKEEYTWRPFKDIWINRFGVEYSLRENYKFRGGYFMRPTPVPDQTGETNFLDSDTHVISVGLGYIFEGLSLDFHVQYRYLVDRETDKLVGTFAGSELFNGGDVWNFGLTLTRNFKAK